MVDTFHPLHLTTEAVNLEKPEYQASWMEDDGEAAFFTAG
jgi:hypothetical protein